MLILHITHCFWVWALYCVSADYIYYIQKNLSFFPWLFSFICMKYIYLYMSSLQCISFSWLFIYYILFFLYLVVLSMFVILPCLLPVCVFICLQFPGQSPSPSTVSLTSRSTTNSWRRAQSVCKIASTKTYQHLFIFLFSK